MTRINAPIVRICLDCGGAYQQDYAETPEQPAPEICSGCQRTRAAKADAIICAMKEADNRQLSEEYATMRIALETIAEHSVCCDARHIADTALAQIAAGTTNKHYRWWKAHQQDQALRKNP